ncbi:MAG: hypothetical protein V3R81_06595 [Gammaproteobacteria bacterium]
MTDEQKKDEGKLVAVLDGAGKTATFGLYREFADYMIEPEEIPWPPDWPDWVSTEFVEAAGYEIYIA